MKRWMEEKSAYNDMQITRGRDESEKTATITRPQSREKWRKRAERRKIKENENFIQQLLSNEYNFNKFHISFLILYIYIYMFFCFDYY